jgi:hypothetical protein
MRQRNPSLPFSSSVPRLALKSRRKNQSWPQRKSPCDWAVCGAFSLPRRNKYEIRQPKHMLILWSDGRCLKRSTARTRNATRANLPPTRSTILLSLPHRYHDPCIPKHLSHPHCCQPQAQGQGGARPGRSQTPTRSVHVLLRRTFSLFCFLLHLTVVLACGQARRPQLMAEQSGQSIGQIGRRMGDDWKALSAADRTVRERQRRIR